MATSPSKRAPVAARVGPAQPLGHCLSGRLASAVGSGSAGGWDSSAAAAAASDAGSRKGGWGAWAACAHAAVGLAAAVAAVGVAAWASVAAVEAAADAARAWGGELDAAGALTQWRGTQCGARSVS